MPTNIFGFFRNSCMGGANGIHQDVPPSPDAAAARRARVALRAVDDHVDNRARGNHGHAGVPRRVGNRAAQRNPDLRFATMEDFRIGNEPDHDLAKVPVARGERVVPTPPPVDVASADLRGRAYLEFVVNDATRLHPSIRVLIESDKILRNPDMNDQQLGDLA